MGGPSLILRSFSDLADTFPLTALIHTEELQVLLANAEKAAHPTVCFLSHLQDYGTDIEHVSLLFASK